MKCWFHKWTGWVRVELTRHFFNSKEPYYIEGQERECEICGFVQQEKL